MANTPTGKSFTASAAIADPAAAISVIAAMILFIKISFNRKHL
jgi:hypothetical protein